LCLIIEKRLAKKELLKRVPRILRLGLTMLIVIVGWVMFNAADMNAAMEIYRAMFKIAEAVSVGFTWKYYLDRRVFTTLVIAVLGAVPLLPWIGVRLQRHHTVSIIKKLALTSMLIISVFTSVSGSYSPFIYFKF
jgi:alginate O-acetyltransferase complex protein AlgI